MPVDKASNNFAIICQKLYCDVLTRELYTTNVFEKMNLEDDKLIESTEGILFDIRINDNDKKFSLLYWTVNFHKNLPKPRFIAGVTIRPTRILRETINKFKIYCSGIKKFSKLNPYWSVNNSL